MLRPCSGVTIRCPALSRPPRAAAAMECLFCPMSAAEVRCRTRDGMESPRLCECRRGPWAEGASCGPVHKRRGGGGVANRGERAGFRRCAAVVIATRLLWSLRVGRPDNCSGQPQEETAPHVHANLAGPRPTATSMPLCFAMAVAHVVKPALRCKSKVASSGAEGAQSVLVPEPPRFQGIWPFKRKWAWANWRCHGLAGSLWRGRP